MNNKEVAHLWANQSRKSASGSHFYFSGDTIYSYGSHFPIARHYNGVVLFTTGGYSSSTARHKGYVRAAISHKTVFHVSDVMAKPSAKDVKEYGESIKHLAIMAATARNPAAALESLQSEVNSANSFCERFGFKTRFEMPDNLDELKERAKASAKRELEQKAKAQAKFERECQVVVNQWLTGESVTIPHNYGKTLLRAVAGEMQTSRGARVTLTEAQKAFRFSVAMRAKGWRRNGESFKVGDYQLDAINTQGVVAGCHRIDWEEIERFAKSQAWA